MIVIIREKATKKQIEQMGEDYGGYFKLVVDLKRKILAGGGEYHADEEQLLIKDGSSQKDLWGGGFDPETGEIDYNSMINIRPLQNNTSREVSDPQIRKKMDDIIKLLI